MTRCVRSYLSIVVFASALTACGDDSDAMDGSVDVGLDGGIDASLDATADATVEEDAATDTGADADTPRGFGDVLDGTWSEEFGLAGASGAIGASVRSVALDGETIYAGGLFESISGVAARNIAQWDGAAWAAMGDGIPDLVLAVEWDADADRVYAGGQSAGFLPMPRSVYVWDGATWSSFASVEGGDVFVIRKLSDGRLAVGGNFTGIAGVPAPGLAVWDGVSWSRWGAALAEGDEVHEVYEAGGVACIAGGFSTSFADNRGVACWDEDRGDWNALTEGLPPGRVFALLSDGDAGELIAGGEFGYLDSDTGDVRAGLARWNGAEWSVFAGGVAGGDINRVRTLARDDEGRVLIGGRFTVVDPLGAAVRAVGTAAWDGSAWASFGDLQDPLEVFVPGLAGAHDLALQDDGDVVLAGVFLEVDEQIASGIALRSDEWVALQPDAASFEGLGGNGLRLALASDGSVYVFGSFTFAGSTRANRLARWNGSGWDAVGEGLPMEALVNTLAVDPATDEVVIGGEFTIGEAQNLARWNGSEWRAIGGSPDGPVTSAVFGSGGDLIVGGLFGEIGDTSLERIGRWNGSEWQALGSGLGANAEEGVAVVAEGPAGVVWAAGSFTETGAGADAVGFARFDGTEWAEAGGGLAPDTVVLALKADNESVWLSGQFQAASDGTVLNSIGRWDGESWNALGDGLTSFGSPAFVSDFVVAGNEVIATGTFGPEDRDEDHLAWWDGDSWQPIGLGTSDLGESLAVDGTTLWVAGLFAAAGEGIPSFGVARWTWNAP
ncbi:MAG: hypothetical protein AAGE52_12680 [Myxococcota bacterium]